MKDLSDAPVGQLRTTRLEDALLQAQRNLALVQDDPWGPPLNIPVATAVYLTQFNFAPQDPFPDSSPVNTPGMSTKVNGRAFTIDLDMEIINAFLAWAFQDLSAPPAVGWTIEGVAGFDLGEPGEIVLAVVSAFVEGANQTNVLDASINQLSDFFPVFIPQPLEIALRIFHDAAGARLIVGLGGTASLQSRGATPR